MDVEVLGSIPGGGSDFFNSFYAHYKSFSRHKTHFILSLMRAATIESGLLDAAVVSKMAASVGLCLTNSETAEYAALRSVAGSWRNNRQRT